MMPSGLFARHDRFCSPASWTQTQGMSCARLEGIARCELRRGLFAFVIIIPNLPLKK
jgi:hypothetical protein